MGVDDRFGKISLVFDREGTCYNVHNRMDEPAHACLYREDYISPTLKNDGGRQHHLWFKKSLAEVVPEVSFDSDFQTLTLVTMLSERFGLKLREHFYGYITYFHGTEEKLAAFAEELKTNVARYRIDEWAQ